MLVVKPRGHFLHRRSELGDHRLGAFGDDRTLVVLARGAGCVDERHRGHIANEAPVEVRVTQRRSDDVNRVDVAVTHSPRHVSCLVEEAEGGLVHGDAREATVSVTAQSDFFVVHGVFSLVSNRSIQLDRNT